MKSLWKAVAGWIHNQHPVEVRHAARSMTRCCIELSRDNAMVVLVTGNYAEHIAARIKDHLPGKQVKAVPEKFDIVAQVTAPRAPNNSGAWDVVCICICGRYTPVSLSRLQPRIARSTTVLVYDAAPECDHEPPAYVAAMLPQHKDCKWQWTQIQPEFPLWQAVAVHEPARRHAKPLKTNCLTS